MGRSWGEGAPQVFGYDPEATPPPSGTEYTLDGTRIKTLDDFWVEIGRAVNGPGHYFAGGLDALDDSLAGGMGNPVDGRCTYVLTDSAGVRERLGYDETVRQLRLRLERCHPTNREAVGAEIARAEAGIGPTAFDWLEEIFEQSPGTLELR